MTSRLDEWFARAAGWWVDAARRRAGRVLLVAALATVGSLVYAARSLGVNADTEAMLSAELPARKLQREIETAFPALDENLALVIDAPSPERARDAAEALAAQLARQPEHFRHVFLPGGGTFFDEHGLLYLDVEELEELADRLAAAQPFLAKLARDPRLPTLLALLERALDEVDEVALPGLDLPRILNGVAAALESAQGRGTEPFSWETWAAGPVLGDSARRRVVLAQPLLDFTRLEPAHEALRAIRDTAQQLGLDEASGVRVRVTGDPALSAEEMELVRRQAAVAALASLLVVALLLGVALRSLRLLLAALATLVAGLAWTAAFAALAIGHLNLISVAFAVLFIGLGVDFGIHFGVRYREQRAEDHPLPLALRESGNTVGGSLLLCALTTAIGFYAFVPTDYAGVAELGLISGTGMLLSLFATLTLLPALLSRMPGAARQPVPKSRLAIALPSLPLRYPRAVCFGAALLALAAVTTVPRMHFDANPLNVRDPNAESVRAMRDLLAGDGLSPWSIELLAPDLERARALARRLESVEAVSTTLTLADFVPSAQAEKLEVLADMGLFLGPLAPPEEAAHAPTDPGGAVRALAGLEEALAARLARDPDPLLVAGANRLGDAAARARVRIEAAPEAAVEVARLEQHLIGDLPAWLARLDRALRAGPVTLGDLPRSLRERYVAPDGRTRVEVFPKEDVARPGALEQFVAAVQAVEPQATGNAVTIVESARAIVEALRQALSAALVAIALLLALLWRSVRDMLLVLAPLLLAALLTAASSVVLGLPFNFADVIVLPLLLGIGIDSGIHLVHRHRHQAPTDRDVLHTSTARAVLFSSLTTIGSFGSLAFSSHRGLASLGQLLTVGVGFTLLANLLVLPALLTWLTRQPARRRRPPPGIPPDCRA